MKDKDLHVIQLADFQIEARNSGSGNRYDEMKTTLERSLSSIRRLHAIDLIVIIGDLIEFADSTTTENELLQWYLHELSTVAPVVVTLGNHDCAQRAVITKDFKQVSKPSQVQVTIDTMRNPRVRLLQRSGFYEDVFGHTFAVWSHWEKYNKDESDQLPFSPWEHENAQTYIDKIESGERIIELYHDPISQCKGWDGEISKTFAEHSTGLHSFRARTILAGDIHMPDIIRFDNNRLFTYCSSTVMRNFGEGNYYRNGNLYQAGNIKHGFNDIIIGADGYTKECEFVPVPPATGRHTIAIDKTFDYTNIELLMIVPETHNVVRLVVEDNVIEFLANHDKIVEHLKSKYDCQVEQPIFDKNILMDYSEGMDIADAAKLADEDTINELASIYIENTIDKTNSIAVEDKREAKDMLIEMFKEQLSKHLDKTSRTNKIELVNMNINNALTFGNDVSVQFDSKGITRITGSNATGKTKIFTIVGWMLTDQLHAGQKSNQHRNNRLDVFNYSLPQDWLENELVFRINGKVHILKKRIERKWKKNISKWDSIDWRDYIADTPTMEIEMQSDNFNSTSYEEIMQYLSKIITFEDFYMYVFVNQSSLERLLHMNPDALIANILKIVGLNIFDALNEKYDIVKQQMLDNLVNPGGSIDTYIQENSDINAILVSSAEILTEKEEEITTIKSANSEDNASILRLTKEIGSAKRVEDVNAEICNANELIAGIENKKTIDIDLRHAKIQEHAKIDVVQINESIGNTSTSIKTSEQALTLAKKSHEDFDATHKTIASEITTYTAAKRAELDGKSQELKTSIANHDVAIAGYTTDINVLVAEVNTRKADLITAHQVKIDAAVQEESNAVAEVTKITLQKNSLSSQLASLDLDLERLNKDIDANMKATTCPTCLRLLSDDAIDAINKVLERDRNQVDVTNGNKTKFESALKIVESNLSSANTAVAVCKENVKTLKDTVIVLTLADCPDLHSKATDIATKVNSRKELKVKLNEDILANDANVEYLKDDYVITRQERLDNMGDEEKRLIKAVKDLESDIETKNVDVKELNEKLALKTTLATEIAAYNSSIAVFEANLKAENDKLLILKSDLETANTASVKYVEIDGLNEVIKNRNTSVNNINESIQEIKNRVLTGETTVKDNETKILQLKQWNLTNSVIRQYKAMLSNTGLQRYIFAKIVDIINNSLNELLQDVDFRLLFDKETLQLKMLDLNKNISSSVVLTSGMETSILGLSLLYCTMTLNQIRSFNFVVIDEISGQLNNGEDLTYEAKNNHLLLVKLLRKIVKTHNIFIVDHCIKYLSEVRSLEVQKTKNGSIIREIIHGTDEKYANK